MAKQKNFDNPATEFGGRSLTGFFNNTEPFEFSVESSTEVHFVASNDFSLVLKGTGFDDDETSLTAGKIKSATFFNADGEKLATITGVTINAAAFFDKISETDITTAFLSMGFKGKDTLIASDLGDMLFGGKGDDLLKGGDSLDFLFGGKGKDRISGGGGNDLFSFSEGDGKDVITDFDFKGGFGQEDAIEVTSEMLHTMDIRKSGKHDALVDFGGGDTILILGMKPGQFETNDNISLA